MIRLASLTTVAAFLACAALTSEAGAQQANLPGIIGGAVEGDLGGAAGAAMGYDYQGRSGYYPGQRGNPYGNRFDNRFDGRYYNGNDGRFYNNNDYGWRDSRYPGYRDDYRTYYRGSNQYYDTVDRNPPADAEPYRAAVVNPEDNQATLHFSVNGQHQRLRPGEQMEFTGRMPRTIRFDRGNGQDVARYQLADGQYSFAATKNGWELYRRPWDQVSASETESADNPLTEVNPQPSATTQPIADPQPADNPSVPAEAIQDDANDLGVPRPSEP